MNVAAMDATAIELVAPGKGILAADESGPTIAKRFESIEVPSTAENRLAYRAALFGTPGLGAFISGAICYDETMRQRTAEGVLLPELLTRQGIIPGIKVDRGTKPLAATPVDKVTEGLDGLADRLGEYARLGARFAKWRAVFAIGPGQPGSLAMDVNAQILGRYAALCQQAGLVPIVEPEVLMDGDHPIERHHEVTEAVLHAVFCQLFDHRVRLEAMLLKVNMILSGAACASRAPVLQVAQSTWRCMHRSVPAAVPGIVFLSGGQGDVEATVHLDALNRIDRAPWELSFSFGRALQAPALRAWAGRPENVAAAQAALLHRARCNSAARFGQYSSAMERGE